MEHVVIDFPERRKVIVDDKEQGYNKKKDGKERVIKVNEGLHTFSLDGEQNFSPDSQDIDVSDTNSVDPLRIIFTIL